MSLNKRSLVSLLLLLLIFPPLFGVETGMSLREVVKITGSRLEWDAMRGIGKIRKKDQVMVISENSPYLLINYDTVRRIRSPGRGEGGDIRFAPEDANFLMDELGVLPSAGNQLYISTIIIDAGHGGKDSGALGRFTLNGETVVIQEKDLVLQVSRSLASRLRGTFPERNVILTRDSDVYLTLEERTEIANRIELDEREAMIFISIHANASLNSKAEGFEVWYLPPDYRRKLIDPEMLDSSAREVAPILNTMLEEEYTVESILLARNILNGMDDRIGMKYVNRGLKEETWFVVRNARMPSVLVEIGFVTNKEEALQMKSGDHLKNITEGIYNGICNFIEHFEQAETLE